MDQGYWERNGSRLQGPRGGHKFVNTPAHEEALARLLYLVEHRRRLGLMFGPSGTGKSWVLETARREAERFGCVTAFVNLLGLESHELLWELAISLRLGPRDGCSRWWLWQAINDHLAALHAAHQPTVLVFDHLERAESDCWGLLERLLHSEAALGGNLTVLAAAREEFREQFVPELTDLCDLRIELPCLDRSETAQLLRGLWSDTEREPSPFDASAVEALHQFSRGEARTIARLSALAKSAREHQALETIDAAALRELTQELAAPSVRHNSRTERLFNSLT